jgi:CarboxypepD_reg-like domain/Secretion system C-terminal sorting domain
MSKHIQLSITDPCHENWDNMTPADIGKFCGSCRKQVVDFSNMSDREVAQFFKKPSTGSVCGRFMQDQLERDISIPRKRIPWVKYFFQFALPAFLVSLKASAQKDRPLIGKVSSVCVRPLMGDTELQAFNIPVDNNPIAKGKVVNEDGEPVSFATVVIKGTHKGAVAERNGTFSLNPDKNWSKLTLVVSAVGYESKEVIISKDDDNNDIILFVSRQCRLSGEVVVTAGLVAVKRQPVRPIPVIQVLKDTAFKFFKVFPNPAVAGNSLHIKWEQTEAGNYGLELLNQSGQLIFTKEIWVDKEARLLDVPIPAVSGGVYFLRMTNSQSGKAYTEKIIIQ